MSYLPSKKFIAVSISLAAAGGLLWLATLSQKTSPLAASQISAAAGGQQENKDSDGDGVADWEEVLRRSDPQNPDSNGNGILDGEEKKLEEAAQKESATSQTPKESLTNSFLKLYSDILKTRVPRNGTFTPDDLALDASTKAALGKTVGAQASQIIESTKTYTRADITISSTATTREYFNALGAILEARLATSEEGAILKLLADLQEKNLDTEAMGADMRAIKGHEYQYRAALADLKALAAPDELATIHIDLLNSFALFAEALREIAEFQKDPLLGIAGLANYNQAARAGNTVFADIKKFLAQNIIAFSPDEKGAIIQKYTAKIKQ